MKILENVDMTIDSIQIEGLKAQVMKKCKERIASGEHRATSHSPLARSMKDRHGI